MIYGDYHTHTSYCDGANSAEEMLNAAIEKGLKYYGFSSHAHLKYDESWNMSRKDQENYIKEVLCLKKKYKDKIEVLLGCEYDLLSDNDLSEFDYVIGSCHSILKDGEYLSVDHSERCFCDCVDKSYGGDYYAFVKDYYQLLGAAAEREEFTFIGHFDLISKFNVDYKYFNEDEERYEIPMYAAIERLVKAGKPFELNTKLVFESTRTEPPPSTVKWLKAVNSLGGQILINSDAHKISNVGYSFDKAMELAKNCGFEHYLILTANGFMQTKIA